ncbi:autotransporter outer membrane beta-barrel domain-containing protein [Cerasicoccus fimbriatus]|uniref:autotransporter outer membrane beta-barrel domain-containing protein n=1 Tax=Cerasicoccus fimbriatus TaxID=3014554 RepID=UPI0022B516AC|nr:autotransporter outer membrane beta-barrel domain-containing protein [Cerasicoccus sp. TK19100]
MLDESPFPRCIGVLLLPVSLAAQSPVTYNAPDPTTPASFENQTTVNASNEPYALSIISQGDAGQPSGGFSSAETLNSLTLTNSDISEYTQLFLVKAAAGNGVSNQDGPDSGTVYSNNFSSLYAYGSYNAGLAMFSTFSFGGNGANDGTGQDGGHGGDISVGSGWDIQATDGGSLSSTASLYGVLAQSKGGNAGDAANGNHGGSGGEVILDSSANIQLTGFTATNTSTDSPTEVYGIFASSVGGNGVASSEDNDNGGQGGSTQQVEITSTAPITLSVASSGSGQTVTGAAIGGLTQGGQGGAAYGGNDKSTGGQGGDAAAGYTSYISITDAPIQVTGDYLGLAQLRNLAGNGGNGGVNQDHSFAGDGGDTGTAQIKLLTDQFAFSTVDYSTNGDYAVGLEASNVAGNGGYTNDYTPDFGGVVGDGGAGGNAGEAQVKVDGIISLKTDGLTSHGIVAFSQGGNGGDAGALSAVGSSGTAGAGGAGGQGGEIDVEVLGGAAVQTTDNGSHGVITETSGGNGGDGGEFKGLFHGDGGNGGNGGSTGATTITIDNASSVSTSGDNSLGIIARSLSGSGGDGGARVQGNGSDGMAGTGGTTGTITIENDGTISTAGSSSYAIYGLANSGAGGNSGLNSSIFYSQQQPGGNSGSVGEIKLTNTGYIHTNGETSYGALITSLGGTGGAAGIDEDSIASIGGSGGAASNGGAINFTNDGWISTQSSYAHGAIIQSIGGGGGDGGSSTGILSIGGSNTGGGGSGGDITVMMNDDGVIETLGSQSNGLIVQSIGGGGGNAGSATSSSANFVLAIGGSGGAGGAGGDVDITSSSNISTNNFNARGITAQSIGGGGGSGGAAYALEVGIEIGGGVAVGGSGGGGGAGGNVSVTTDGGNILTGQFVTPPPTAMNVLPSDAIGILAQSIGGGGGAGGSSFAEAVNIGLPTNEEGASFAASLALSHGGSGGVAGNAAGSSYDADTSDGVFVNIQNNTNIQTQGQGSHGVLAQGIGGGGGHGGDSTALATTVQYVRISDTGILGGEDDDGGGDDNNFDRTYSAQLSVANGGNGGAAGYGGRVNVTMGGGSSTSTANTPDNVVTTYGDYSNGITAQSVGGGGGNAGVGSGTTAGYGNTESVGATIVVGSQGGAGGNGGDASVTTDANNAIVTYGSSSHGAVAQSIGGGGGTSQGGMISLRGTTNIEIGNGPFSLQPEGLLNIGLGATGGYGGTAGSATATINGGINTYGNDAVGLIVQAIGGGGGIAGSAGSDASADNPVVLESEGLRAFINSTLQLYLPIPLYANLQLGSYNTGSDGHGGVVNAELGGSITTRGDWAHAILAQSIGGGGGKAGTAIPTGSQSTNMLGGNGTSIDSDFDKVYLIGGRDGGNGNGNSVTVTMNGTINTGVKDGNGNTRGFSAFGILAQSIGGGGGIGADGSDSASGTIQVGRGGATGNADTVTLNADGFITTYGQAAHAVVLQSIGAGGGIGGAGSSAANAPASSITTQVAGNASISGASGYGNTVTISEGSFLNINTHGDNAMGVLAQSIGGSGGYAAVVNPVQGEILANSDGQEINGGKVDLNFDNQSLIQTTGVNAHGVLAQSIGGGGGISGLVTSTSSAPKLATIQGQITSGEGATVNISLDETSEIITGGAGAHGIIAQSIGGGGGIYTEGADWYYGSNGFQPIALSSGGDINITIDGAVTTRGENSIGVLAQSTSPALFGNDITIDVNGNLVGVVTGAYVIHGNANTVNVGASGYLRAEYAVQFERGSEGNMNLNVAQGGTVDGSIGNGVNANYGSADIQVNNAGTFYAGPEMFAEIHNTGDFYLGSGLRRQPRVGTPEDFQKTTVQFDFKQSPTGAIYSYVDFEHGLYDQLHILGDATLDGGINVQAVSLMPDREYPVVIVDGALSGSIAATEQDGIFQYIAEQRDNQVFVRAEGADFTPPGIALNPNASAMAQHLQSIWDNGGSGPLAETFAALDQAASTNPALYSQTLNSLSPGVSTAFGATRLQNMQRFASSVLSYPLFVGDTAQLYENETTWTGGSGGTTHQDSSPGVDSFRVNNTMWQAGGQKEIDHNWFLGGAIAYEYSWMDSGTGAISGHGQSAVGAITLKNQRGPWLFAGAIHGSASFYSMDRQVTAGGVSSIAKSDPKQQSIGAFAQVKYTYAWDDYYLRPSLSLDTTTVFANGYTESNPNGLGLTVSSDTTPNFTVLPGIEIGGRINTSKTANIRWWVGLAGGYSVDDSYNTTARLTAAPAGAAPFESNIPIDDFFGRVEAGLQWNLNEHISIQGRYNGEFGDTIQSHGGKLSVAYQW